MTKQLHSVRDREQDIELELSSNTSSISTALLISLFAIAHQFSLYFVDWLSYIYRSRFRALKSLG